MSNEVDGTDRDEVLPPRGRRLDGVTGRRGVLEHDEGPWFRVGGVTVSDADNTVADVVSGQTDRSVGGRGGPAEANT